MHVGQCIVDSNLVPAFVDLAERAQIFDGELRRDEELQLRWQAVHVSGRRGC